MENNHISVLVVENNFSFRNKIVKTLKNEFGILNALGCPYSEDIDNFFKHQNPDIVILSYNPENFMNIGQAIEFNKKYPETNTFALLNNADNSYHSVLKRLGFKSFIREGNFRHDFDKILNILVFQHT